MKHQVVLMKTANLILILALLFGYQWVQTNRAHADQVAKLEYENALLAMEMASTGEAADATGDYVDGTYEGNGVGFGGDISVSVQVEDGRLTQITILDASKEDKAYLDMAMEMIPVMVENQTWEVDTISGATYSSNGIRDAVNMALEGAVK